MQAPGVQEKYKRCGKRCTEIDYAPLRGYDKSVTGPIMKIYELTFS